MDKTKCIDKMNIAIYNYQEFNEYIGGIERVSISLTRSLIKRDVNVIFDAVHKSQYNIEYRTPVPMFFLPDEDATSVNNIKEFKRILAEQNIDVVLNQDAHSLASHELVWKVVQGTSVKYISALHFCPTIRNLIYRHPIDWNMFSFRENCLRLLKGIAYKYPFCLFTMKNVKKHYRRLYEESNRVVLLSERNIPEYAKVGRLKNTKKLCAINNMLSFERKDVDCTKDNKILFCARVSPQKRPERALYVWKEIYKKLPGWSIDVVGDGNLLDRLKRLSDKLNLERVTFHGFKNPIDFYKCSKIFLMTSDYEGWGLTLTEAMQYKCVPVVMSTYSSIFDIVDDGKNGCLILNVDCKTMADKVLWLAENPQKLNDMADEAYKKTQCFAADKIADKWISVFEEVLHQKDILR